MEGLDKQIKEHFLSHLQLFKVNIPIEFTHVDPVAVNFSMGEKSKPLGQLSSMSRQEVNKQLYEDLLAFLVY